MDAVAATPRSGARLEAIGLLVTVLAMLIVSRLLPPDPRGFGTHEKLLLPPCLFHTITHLPCPFCGMTTGFSFMARGDVRDAVRANPGAPLLFVVACLLVGLSARAAVRDARVLPPWATGQMATRIAGIIILLLWLVHIVFVLTTGFG